MLAALVLTMSVLASPPQEVTGTPNCRFATFDRTGRQATVTAGPIYEPAALYVTRLTCSFTLDVPSYAGYLIVQDTQGPVGLLGTGGCWADPAGPAFGCNALPPYAIAWDPSASGHDIWVCTRTASRADPAGGTRHGCSILATA